MPQEPERDGEEPRNPNDEEDLRALTQDDFAGMVLSFGKSLGVR